MAYATVQDLNTLLGYTPDSAQVLLDRASRDVDRAIQCATYTTDSGGLPTDQAILATLKSATLEQAAFQLQAGNKTGIRHGLQSGVPSGTSAGSVELSRGQSVGGSSAGLPWLADQADWILRQAGLRPRAPQTYTWGRFT